MYRARLAGSLGRRLAISSIAVALIVAPARFVQAQTVEAARASVSSLVEKLDHSEVDRVDIFAIPADVYPRIAITPQTIETQFQYRFTIRTLRGSGYEKDMKKAVSTLSITKTAEPSDLRWAVVFYDLRDARIAGVYFDRSGSTGYVDQTPVVFAGGLFPWVTGQFSRVIR
jgi:hypothetical protein